MITLATQIANGDKQLNIKSINEMLEVHMDKAHKVLQSGYDKNKAWDLFHNILQKNTKATQIVMDEAMARFKGEEAWTMKNYTK
jgi:hypothetical protein